MQNGLHELCDLCEQNLWQGIAVSHHLLSWYAYFVSQVKKWLPLGKASDLTACIQTSNTLLDHVGPKKACVYETHPLWFVYISFKSTTSDAEDMTVLQCAAGPIL
jgi:hypothetical protein